LRRDENEAAAEGDALRRAVGQRANVAALPAIPGPSALATIEIVEPEVATSRSPFGSAASSRAPPTFATTLATKPDGDVQA
jgi:hypothetical protein